MTDDRIQTGEADAVSRRAGQRSFTAATVVPSDVFDRLLEDLDEDAEVAPRWRGPSSGAAARRG